MDDNDEISVSDVLDRLFEVYGVSSEAALAEVLGKARTTVNAWKIRNSVPYDVCVAASKKYGLSLDWLVLGEGEKYRLRRNPVPLDADLIRVVMRATLEWVHANDYWQHIAPDDMAALMMVMYNTHPRKAEAPFSPVEMENAIKETLSSLKANQYRK